MTEHGTIGPAGTVRLCCYLPSAHSVWFSAGCRRDDLFSRYAGTQGWPAQTSSHSAQ
jgi:hypothetical protein